LLNEEQLDNMFADFITSGNGDDSIKQLYNVLPYLNTDQQRALTLYKSLAVKYDSAVLQSICDSILSHAKSNRKLGFRFGSLLESYALKKHFQGYRATGNMNEEGK
jgi:hypothetical protein